MSRRLGARVFRHDGEKMVEVTHRLSKAPSKAGPLVLKDIEPFVSPIDGSVIASRAALREHEKRHNVRQLGNDWAGDADHPPPADWHNWNKG